MSGTPRTGAAPPSLWARDRSIRAPCREIADQAVLDSLRAFFPQAKVAHAYASTEAGVGFAVNDGREGFPSSLLDGSGTRR
jgi:hypothetical protein